MRLPKPKKIIAPRYVAGLSLFKRKMIKIKLSANESALGPSPKAIKEYNKVSKNFKRYPDTNGTTLKKVIANKFKIDKDRIVLGSGSDQIFELACNAFIKKNDEVIVPKYSFIIYRIYSKLNGAKIIYAKEKNFTISVKDILSKVTRKTKLVFLANPNNPTGTYITKKEVMHLRKKLRNDILLVIDDAYSEYLNEKDYLSGLKLFSKYKNVLVTRTFSKGRNKVSESLSTIGFETNSRASRKIFCWTATLGYTDTSVMRRWRVFGNDSEKNLAIL